MASLQADSVTIALLIGTIGLFLLHVLLRPASPLAHPILLGRQGESAKVRNKGESAVWTNALATSGLLVASSQGSVKGVKHIVKPDEGLVRKLKSLGVSKENPGAVLLCLDEEKVARDLIAAAVCVEGLQLVLVQPSLVEALPSLLKQISKPLVAVVSSSKYFSKISLPDVKLISVDSVANGKAVTLSSMSGNSEGVTDFPVEPRAVVIQAAVLPPNGKPVLLDLTNQSLTASAHAISQLLTASNLYKLAAKDHILSFYSVLSPFGLSIYLSSLLTKSAFTSRTTSELSETLRTIQSVKPTCLFVPTISLAQIVKHLSADLQRSTNAWTHNQIWSNKLNSLRDGILAKHAIWDASFSPLSKLRYANLRAVVAFADGSGEVLKQNQVDAARVLLGPTVHGTKSWMSPSPITASLMHDFQALAKGNEGMHVGPPVINVQVKVVLEDEEEMVGELLVDGPGMVRPSKEFDGLVLGEGWLKTGWQAKILPNGTVKLQ